MKSWCDQVAGCARERSHPDASLQQPWEIIEIQRCSWGWKTSVRWTNKQGWCLKSFSNLRIRMFKACCITWNCHLLFLFRIPLSQWSDKVRVSPYIDPNFISDRSQNQMSNSPSNHSVQHPTNSASLLPRALQTSPVIDLSRRPRWYQVLKLENFLIAEQTPDQKSLTCGLNHVIN